MFLNLVQLKEFKKAINDSTKAIHLAPGYTKSYHRRAVALHKLGDLHGALNDYQVHKLVLYDYISLSLDVRVEMSLTRVSTSG